MNRLNKILKILTPFIGALVMNGCNHHHKTDFKIFRYNESAGISSLDPAFARNNGKYRNIVLNNPEIPEITDGFKRSNRHAVHGRHALKFLNPPANVIDRRVMRICPKV
jgi:hypothetical protein